MTAWRLLWVMILVGSIGGCAVPRTSPPTSPPSDERQFANWPSLLDEFRFKWTASPGIDVTTGPAMIVRAYLESYAVAQSTLDADNVYPGFNRATPENLPREGNYQLQFVNIRPMGPPFTSGPEDATPKYGYETFHFLELTPAGRGYRGIVCSGHYATFVASRSHPGKFFSVAARDGDALPFPRNSSGVSAHQVELTQDDPRIGADAPPNVVMPQDGPQPAPDQDVFGNWFITAAGGQFWGPKNDPKSFRPQLRKRCEDAMPTPTAERLAIITGFKDSPPPHGDPIPGWPTKSQ